MKEMQQFTVATVYQDCCRNCRRVARTIAIFAVSAQQWREPVLEFALWPLKNRIKTITYAEVTATPRVRVVALARCWLGARFEWLHYLQYILSAILRTS